VEGERPNLNMTVHLVRIYTEECTCFVVISVGNEQTNSRKSAELRDDWATCNEDKYHNMHSYGGVIHKAKGKRGRAKRTYDSRLLEDYISIILYSRNILNILQKYLISY
jgi:hypothetical protein